MIHTSRIQSYRIQSCRIPYILSVFAVFHPRSGADVSYHVFPLPYVQPVELTSLLHAVDKLDAQVLGSPFWDVARRSGTWLAVLGLGRGLTRSHANLARPARTHGPIFVVDLSLSSSHL